MNAWTEEPKNEEKTSLQNVLHAAEKSLEASPLRMMVTLNSAQAGG